MKKYIALLLCVALLVGVTACGDDTPKDADTTASSTVQSTVTTTMGEGSTTSADTSAATTTATGADVTPSTNGTSASVGTGTPTSAATTATKAPASSATTGSRPTSATASVGSTPTSSAPTTGTTQTAVAVPDVTLPAIGSDIDVSNPKNRIRVSAASAAYNADGTIGVTLTFKNYSTWITEETDYVLYTCYDKDGNVVQNATKLSIGCIDTKKHPQRTFTFTVPAATAEVRITRSKIVYWTEWS